jgi:hypothetical protein
MMIMTTKEELLKFGTYNTKGVPEEYLEKMIPTAIYVWRGRIVAVEWVVDGVGRFVDDENIASIAHRISIK